MLLKGACQASCAHPPLAEQQQPRRIPTDAIRRSPSSAPAASACSMPSTCRAMPVPCTANPPGLLMASVTPLGNDHGVKILAQPFVRRPDMRFFHWRGPVTQMWRQTEHLASHQPVSWLCLLPPAGLARPQHLFHRPLSQPVYRPPQKPVDTRAVLICGNCQQPPVRPPCIRPAISASP